MVQDRSTSDREEPFHDQSIPHSAPAAGTGTIEASGPEAGGPIKRFLKILGPGFITGASDDDPSGIGTYAVAGASLGFDALWTAPLTFPLMAPSHNEVMDSASASRSRSKTLMAANPTERAKSAFTI